MRMVAATLEKKDVVLAISTTGKPKEVMDAVAIAKEYGATVIAVTKPNSPLAAGRRYDARTLRAGNAKRC